MEYQPYTTFTTNMRCDLKRFDVLLRTWDRAFKEFMSMDIIWQWILCFGIISHLGNKRYNRISRKATLVFQLHQPLKTSPLSFQPLSPYWNPRSFPN